MKKERKVIDAHLHIFGHCEFGDRLAHGIGDEPTQEYLTEKYYGRLGIEKGIVMGNGPLEEQGKNLGEYFYYSAGLDEKDSWLKLEEIESHLQRKRCVGVKLYPGYYELYPNDKSLYPIYKMTEEYGKVLSVHTGMVAGNGGHLKYCRPIHLDDIATDFPGLKIVMCHFGNPFLQEAAAVLEKNPNMYADLSGLIEGAFETETFIKDQSGYLEILKSWMHYVSDYGTLILGGTIKYLTKYGYDRNPLQQVRDGVKAAEADNAKYDPHKEGSHFCDFCGVELAGGEYELLKDGRERCNHCSSTALRTGEEFKEVYKMVVRNMEIFFGIKLNVAIKVRMTDAKTIAKHFGEEFVATPGFDGRVLGFAQKDSSGYSLYIENGSPKLAAMATIAHELTHIWQYQNWDEKMILSKYGKQYRLEIYEGMAKWAEIQYLLYLNEISYAKRQEIVTRLRDDEYGRGFIQYAKKYPLAYRHEKNATPFGRIPPL